MVEELRQRGSMVILFFPGRIDGELKNKVKKTIDTRGMKESSIREKIKEINPDIVICFTEEDTRICFPLPYVMRETNFYYFNLEIYTYFIKEKNLNSFAKIARRIEYFYNKFREILYVKGCQAIVIQDKLRKKILKKYWISHPVTWLIPNSYYSDYHEYDVPHKSGLIYSGCISPVVLSSLVEQADDMNDVEITIAGFIGSSKIKLKEKSNIKMIVQDLSQEEYTKFISAYDIALIWYSERNYDNAYNIGLSSGKFFKHMSLGQPVIANYAPGLAEEINKYKLGIVINDLSELKTAVKTIYDNYNFYVNNIKRLYEKRYDYKKVSKKFFDVIIADASAKHLTR